MSKDIINRNSKGQYHGYKEYYYTNGELWFKCFYNNDEPIDYEEYYPFNGGELYKRFWV